MRISRRGAPAVWLLYWFFVASELCASLNHEGAALLRFKEMIHVDPHGALLDWDEASISHCSWFGVDCSDDGRVLSLNLANLGLKGILSPDIGKLAHMHSLILRNNSFYGIIPTEIRDLKVLKALDMGYNNFSGPVPSDLRNVLSLEFLFLKGNRLLGGLPVELHELTRNMGNATTRKLLASKRKGSQKTNIVDSGLVIVHAQAPTNHQLAPSPEPIPPPLISPAIEQPASQANKGISSSTIYALIGAAIGFVVVALSAVCFLYYRRRKTSAVVPLSAISSRQLRTIAAEEINSFRLSELEKACEGFSNIIDRLPEHVLFKGTLPCGAEIAVASKPVTYVGDKSGISETHYRNMIEALSKSDHKNLMNLVGYCEDEDPFVRMMVFEYVSNGTLFEHLHVKEAEHLDWQSRLRIAMGVVYCLDYMYQQSPHVILRNLNSSCIYLTEDNAAKVSDISFWHGKKQDGDEFDAADEYSMVHSFALLLLEMISGRCPYSEDYMLLVLWARRYLTGVNPVMGMVDPTLNSVPEEHIRALTELIQLCVNEDRMKRPRMADVTRRMQAITGITEAQAIPRSSKLWWAELEIITS
ncbi:hypothetical protein ACP4OV_028801 [Aristida adscensionis]